MRDNNISFCISYDAKGGQSVAKEVGEQNSYLYYNIRYIFYLITVYNDVFIEELRNPIFKGVFINRSEFARTM